MLQRKQNHKGGLQELDTKTLEGISGEYEQRIRGLVQEIFALGDDESLTEAAKRFIYELMEENNPAKQLLIRIITLELKARRALNSSAFNALVECVHSVLISQSLEIARENPSYFSFMLGAANPM